MTIELLVKKMSEARNLKIGKRIIFFFARTQASRMFLWVSGRGTHGEEAKTLLGQERYHLRI